MFADPASTTNLISHEKLDRYSIRRAAALIVGGSITLWCGLFALTYALI